MIGLLEVFLTVMAFLVTFGSGYMFYTYRGMKAARNPEQKSYAFFTAITGLCGFTFFSMVLANLT